MASQAPNSLPALKTGDTLVISCTSKDELGQPLDLTGITVQCMIQLPDGSEQHSLTVVVSNQTLTPGVFVISAEASETATWVAGLYEADIEQSIGDKVTSSSTFYLPVSNGITP
jgi:hypothetical protein